MLSILTLEPVRSVKAVSFQYEPSAQVANLLETFRQMVNHAIRICLSENIKGRLNLRNRIYWEFRTRYGVLSGYPYSAAEIAWSIVKKHKRWNRKPYARHAMLKLDYQRYSIEGRVLQIQYLKGQRLEIPLKFGDYQRSFLMDKTLKRGSVIITDRTISIAFSKEVALAEHLSMVGLDLNQKSLVASDGTKYDLSEVARLHTEYEERRSKFYERHPNDKRLKKKFSSLSREKARVKQFLNRISKSVVERAKQRKEGIVLERLKGIRFTHRRGNGEIHSRRKRISQWPFRKLQAMIEYKANWEGVPIEYVSASWTSKRCSECGAVNKALKPYERSWQCPCGAKHDRDLNAAKNIASRSKLGCTPVVRVQAGGM